MQQTLYHKQFSRNCVENGALWYTSLCNLVDINVSPELPAPVFKVRLGITATGKLTTEPTMSILEACRESDTHLPLYIPCTPHYKAYTLLEQYKLEMLTYDRSTGPQASRFLTINGTANPARLCYVRYIHVFITQPDDDQDLES
jgi:hypothetical protein